MLEMSESNREPEEKDIDSAYLEDLATSIDFSAGGWLRRLKDAVHQRIRSNWNEESKICTATITKVSERLAPNTLVREFLHTGNGDFWINLMLFASLVESVAFSMQEIAELEASLPPEVYDDMAISQYLHAIRRWAVRSPARAEELLDRMLMPEGSAIRRLHVVTLEGLGEATNRGDYSRESLDEKIAESIARSDDLRAGVALAYPSLIASGFASEDDYRKKMSEWISSEANETVAGAAVQSIGLVLSRNSVDSSGYYDLMRAAASDERSAVRLGLLTAIRPLTDSDTEEARQLLHEIIPAFLSTPVSNEGAIRQLSWLLFGLADKHPRLVMAFLRGWAERGEDGLPLWHSQRFLHVINHVPPDVLASEAVAWIVSSRQLEEIGLRLILDEHHLRSLPPSAIARLTVIEIEICALVFAWYDDHRVEVAHLLASLVKEALTRRDCKRLLPLFEELLLHAVENYPGTSTRLLAAIQESRVAASRALVKKLRRVATERAEILKKIHDLPEFIPSEDRQRVYQRFDRDFRWKVHSGELDDPGRHPLLAMFRKSEIQLLGGGSLLSADSETFGAVQPLGQVSVETELPRLQVLDPQFEQLRRVNLRLRFEELRRTTGGASASPAP